MAHIRYERVNGPSRHEIHDKIVKLHAMERLGVDAKYRVGLYFLKS
jgi:hypothetical protein